MKILIVIASGAIPLILIRTLKKSQQQPSFIQGGLSWNLNPTKPREGKIILTLHETFGACDAIPVQAKMPPASQPPFQEGVHPGWQGWDRVWLGAMSNLTLPPKQQLPGKHKTPELAAICHPPMLTSRAAERRSSMIREYILQHICIFKPFSFLSILVKSSVSPCPLHSHTFSLQPNYLFFHMFSMVSVGISIQFFRLSFKNYLFQFIQICISNSEFHI